MKKFLPALVVLMLFFTAAYDMPPQLPSSFYGVITPTQREGTPISAWVNGARLATSAAIIWEGQSYYAMNVPCNEGDPIVFRIRGVIAGEAICHIGTNTKLNLNILPTVKQKK